MIHCGVVRPPGRPNRLPDCRAQSTIDRCGMVPPEHGSCLLRTLYCETKPWHQHEEELYFHLVLESDPSSFHETTRNSRQKRSASRFLDDCTVPLGWVATRVKPNPPWQKRDLTHVEWPRRLALASPRHSRHSRHSRRPEESRLELSHQSRAAPMVMIFFQQAVCGPLPDRFTWRTTT